MSGVNSGWLLESLFFLLACNSRLYHHYAGCLLSMIVGISYFSFLPVWSRWACIYGAALNGRCFPAMSSLVSSSSVSSAHLHQVNKIRKCVFLKKAIALPDGHIIINLNNVLLLYRLSLRYVTRSGNDRQQELPYIFWIPPKKWFFPKGVASFT